VTSQQTADAARLAAFRAGLPPDVHDPATLAAYQALRGGGEQAEPKAKPASSKTGSRQKQ
jgi:hypothetical protein